MSELLCQIRLAHDAVQRGRNVCGCGLGDEPVVVVAHKFECATGVIGGDDGPGSRHRLDGGKAVVFVKRGIVDCPRLGIYRQ